MITSEVSVLAFFSDIRIRIPLKYTFLYKYCLKRMEIDKRARVAVWPDGVKFCHFGKISKVSVYFLQVYFVFVQNIKPTLVNILCFWGNFIVDSGQILKNNTAYCHAAVLALLFLKIFLIRMFSLFRFLEKLYVSGCSKANGTRTQPHQLLISWLIRGRYYTMLQYFL